MRITLLLAGLFLLVTSVFAAESTLEIDKARSHIEVDVKATMHSFTGKLSAYNPIITINADTGRVTLAQLQFRFADLKTGNEDRDKQMRDWQATEQFPECVYLMKSLDPATSDGRYTARGTFILHGVSRDIAFPVVITTDKKLYTIDGELPIDVRDYALPVIKKYLFAKVDPVVKVRFHLQGTVVAK